MTRPERMNKLIERLTLACTWCLAVGHWQQGDAKDLPLNKHYRPALKKQASEIDQRVLAKR